MFGSIQLLADRLEDLGCIREVFVVLFGHGYVQSVIAAALLVIAVYIA